MHRMDLVAVSRNMVDTIGGSWLACRDLVRIIGQCAPTCLALANSQKVLSRMLRERFPGLDRFLRLQNHVHRLELVNIFYEAIEWPMTIEEVLVALLQNPMDQERSISRAQRFLWANRGIRRCSVKACGRPLGVHLLHSPIGTENIDLETDVYGIYQWDPTYPRMPTLCQLHKHLTEMRMYHGECRIYSERRNSCVGFHWGCFACSGQCYKDIVNALWLWEGPCEEQQVVVITASAHETNYQDLDGPGFAHAQEATYHFQWEREREQLGTHHQGKPKTSKGQRKKIRKQLENKRMKKREKRRRNRAKKKEQRNNSRLARGAVRNGN